MEIVFKNIWVLFILVTIFNVFAFKKKTAKLVLVNPEKENGYQMIIKNMIVFGFIPWLIIGFGNTFGTTNSVFDYFQPAKLNPYVLLFHFSILIIWTLLVRFVFFKNGAKFLENHPGLIVINNFGSVNENPSEKTIKMITVLALMGGIIGMIVMWVVEIPIPPIK